MTVDRVSTPRWGARLGAGLPPWEFWPAWAAYLPVIPWIAAMALRHRSLGVITAANPGMPDGGIVGESKFDILRSLPRAWTVPSARIDEGPLDARVGAVAAFAEHPDVSFPLVLKPDVGQRGAGVRRVGSVAEARAYLATVTGTVVAQPWHPGPHEAGLFYWRHPDEPRGRISSITHKVFPAVTGDGRRTLAALVHDHPRYVRQATVFLARHAAEADRVLEDGERFALGLVGNHCQGTMFRDGAHLWTPALDARVDAIARQVPGFFIGRFDVRYSDAARFRAGENFAIVELNGVTAEPTDIYDPDRSVASAYRALFEQWRLAFAIGAANRRRGERPASTLRLARLALVHLRDGRVFPTSA